jgi:L-rhamnose mutarotase
MMKRVGVDLLLFGVVMLSLALYSRGQQGQPARTGMLIGIKPDRIAAYEALHAASNPGVRDLLDKYHMHNFSIYIHKMDDSHYYLFAYYEYTGTNASADAEAMAREPRNQKWLSRTDAMQIPLPGASGWTKMEEVYHNP